MNAKDAKMLVKEYHDTKAKEELISTLSNIEKAATNGESQYFTYFNYERNVQELKDLGFDVNVRSKVNNEVKEKYVVYYDITWREDV